MPQKGHGIGMNQGRVQVALVDDDPAYLRALGRLLQVAGYEPLAYSSAERFLDELPQFRQFQRFEQIVQGP